MSSTTSALIMTANHAFNTNANLTLFSNGYCSEIVALLTFLAGFILCSSHRIRLIQDWLVPTKKTSTKCSHMQEEKKQVPLPVELKQLQEDVELKDLAFEIVQSSDFLSKEVNSPKSILEITAHKFESGDPLFNEALAAAAQLPVSNDDISYSWMNWFEDSTQEEEEESEDVWGLRGASVEEALCQWRCCQEKSGDPDGDLLGAVVEICLAAAALDEAFSVAREACWNIPQRVTGKATLLKFIEALAERGNLSRAYEAYSNLHANGLEMDLHMYHAMLTTAARAADLEKLERLFKDLVDAEIEPEYNTFSIVVRGYCATGNLEKAMALFGTMRQHGIAPTQTLFNALLACCARKHMVVLAEQILQDMMDSGVHPNSSTVTILVRLYGHARDLGSAFSWATELSERYKFELAGDAYGALIAASLLNNQLDSALCVFQDMPSEGCVLPARTYGILITACLRDGDLVSAVQLVDNAFAFNSEGQQPRARLERSLLEDVLRLIGRRRQSVTLGAPLLHRLTAANVEISDELAAAVLQDTDRPAPASRFHARRSAHNSWRCVL